EDASDWWIDHWARRPEAEIHALTWEQMKTMVRSKFLPQSFWDRMEHGFYHLQQGSSTVDEYIRTFTRMCFSAGDAVNTDAKKARKFLKGLNQRIRELVGSHGLMSYADTVSRAQEVESCLIPIAPVPSYYHASQPSQTVAQYTQPISSVPPDSSSGKRKIDSHQDNKKGKRAAPDRRDIPPATQGQLPKCSNCGRPHSGQCRYTQRVCFNCLRPGHFISACPEPRRQPHQQQPPQQQEQHLPPPPHAMQHDLPKKERDPGGFIIHIALGNGKVASGMLELGAGINLMPFSIFQRLGLGDLRPTRMCLQLADRSIRYPKGIVEDVLVKVGKLIIPVDFVVLDVGDVHENGKDHTILLGRPFMATTNTLIDVKNGTLNMTVFGESVSISVREAGSASSVNFVEECAFIDQTDPFINEMVLHEFEEV
ncbi:Unknown protein, partial [Striga hermonthica]